MILVGSSCITWPLRGRPYALLQRRPSCKGLCEQRDGLLGVLVGDGQRWQQANRSWLRDIDDQPALEQVGSEPLSVESLIEADAEHQTAAAHLAHTVQRRDRLAEARAEIANPPQQLLLVDYLEHRERGARLNETPGEGRAVIAGIEDAGGVWRGDAGPDR